MLGRTIKKRRRLSRITRAVLGLVLVFAALLAVRSSVLRPYRVGGPSAAPTVLVGDLIWVNLLVYGARLPFTSLRIMEGGTPKRGDLAFCRLPGMDGVYIKRVIGVDGDVVELHGNELIVNGRRASYTPLDPASFRNVPAVNALGDRFAIERMDGVSHVITHRAAGVQMSDYGPVRVPPDHYFVLGDNRDHSYDSRAESCGFVPRSAMLGRMIGTGRPIPAQTDPPAAEQAGTGTCPRTGLRRARSGLEGVEHGDSAADIPGTVSGVGNDAG